MIRITLPLTALLLLVGCAETTPMAPGRDHPANPGAAAAPVPPPSTTLAVTPTPSTKPARDDDAKPPSHDAHHEHANHGAGAATRPATRQHAESTYVCPMHPEVVSDKPGTCPKCKMDLVKRKEAEHERDH